LLLQAGETADGVTPLIDRQQLHGIPDELKATYGDSPVSFMLFLRSIIR
jgi:hypothetical protein